jgi:excisionase family DNA binding protein
MLAVPPQAAPQDPSDRLLKAEEAAAILGLSVDTLYKSAATKTLRVKIGTNVRFSHAAIQRYIARQRGK